MDQIQTTDLFWYRIKVYTKRGGDMVETLYWELLPFQVRTKWDWYFKYRAALLQVKYPKFVVDQHWGNTKKVDAEAISIRNSIISLKGKITKLHHKIESAMSERITMRVGWNQLFPIEEDPRYIELNNVLCKLDAMMFDTCNELQSKLELLNQNQ